MAATGNAELESNFSAYGKYSIKKELTLSYPYTQVNVKKTDDKLFSYYRKNSEGETIEKILSKPSGSLDLEICPILPMNLPARKTNDLMFLRFEKQVYVSKDSTIDVFVPFPIEIGVFVKDESSKGSSLLDCFTCEPLHSRFALYGFPDNGNLCMYAKVPVQKQTEPFIYAMTRISISNKTDNGVLVGKVVFPVTNHNMYYIENTAEAHIDDISMTIEKVSHKNIATISHVEYKPKENWRMAPSIEKKEENVEFVMDRGIE